MAVDFPVSTLVPEWKTPTPGSCVPSGNAGDGPGAGGAGGACVLWSSVIMIELVMAWAMTFPTQSLTVKMTLGSEHCQLTNLDRIDVSNGKGGRTETRVFHSGACNSMLFAWVTPPASRQQERWEAECRCNSVRCFWTLLSTP